MAIQNRYEFMYYVACTNANPNGDPDMGNIKQNRVMTQNHQPILIVDLCVLLDALPIRAELSFHAVMVALNQVLLPLQPLHNPNTVFFVFPERIAEYIDCII